MEGEKVVVDASVVVKWFVEEEYSKEALMLRDSYADGAIDLIAPSLLRFEVINALKYSGAFGEDELKEVLRALDDYQITLFDLEGDYGEKAIEIVMRKGITMYDAAYVALALVQDATLYTADEKLLEKVNEFKQVRHVREFTL